MNIVIRLLILFTTAVVTSTAALSQDEKPREADSSVVPSRVDSAAIRLPLPDGRTRVVSIRRGRSPDGSSSYDYFHMPLFAFDEAAMSIDELPRVVHRKTVTDGFVAYDFVIVASEAVFLDIAKKQLLLDAREVVGEANFDPEKIRLQPWPLKHVIADVKGNSDTYNWDLHSTSSLDSEGDTWRLQIRIPTASESKFEEHLNRGDLSFGFRFTYENVVQTSVRQEILLRDSFESSIQRALNSLNIAPGEPIRQDQETQLRTAISRLVTTNTTGFGPDLSQALASLSSKPTDAVFDTHENIDVTDLNTVSPPELAKQIFGHIQAILNEYDTRSTETDSQERTDETTDSTTDKQEDTTVTEFSVSVKAPSVEGGSGADVNVTDTDKSTYEIKNEDRTEIKTKHGLELVQGSNKGELVPANINISFVASTWQSQISRSVQNVSIAFTTSENYEVASPVPVSFTRKSIQYPEELQVQSSQFPFVPLGGALCYFGKDTPFGYQLLDASHSWPLSENWVPDSLAGESMPNMNAGAVVVGTNATSNLGMHETSEPIKIKSIDLQVDPTLKIDLRNSAFMTKHDNTYYFDTFKMRSQVADGAGRYRQGGDVLVDPITWNDGGSPLSFIMPTRYWLDRIPGEKVVSHNDLVVEQKEYLVQGYLPESNIDLKVKNLPNVSHCRWIVRVN